MSWDHPQTRSELLAYYRGRIYALELDIMCLACVPQGAKGIKTLRASIAALQEKIADLEHQADDHSA